MSKSIRNAKALQSKSRNHKVIGNPRPGVYQVQSGSSGEIYEAIPATGGCTCKWSQYNGRDCSHVMAAKEYEANNEGRTCSFWREDQTEAIGRQKKKTEQVGYGLVATTRKVRL